MIRRALLGCLALAAFGLAACSTTTSSGAPSGVPGDIIDASPLVDASPIVDANALEGFCADFQTTVANAWPNIDATTASTLTASLQDRMDDPEMASVQADISTITTWLTSVATQTAAGTPPPEVSAAFDNLTAFADSNC